MSFSVLANETAKLINEEIGTESAVSIPVDVSKVIEIIYRILYALPFHNIKSLGLSIRLLMHKKW